MLKDIGILLLKIKGQYTGKGSRLNNSSIFGKRKRPNYSAVILFSVLSFILKESFQILCYYSPSPVMDLHGANPPI